MALERTGATQDPPVVVTTVERISGKGSVHLQVKSTQSNGDGREIVKDVIFGPDETLPEEVQYQLDHGFIMFE